MWKWFLNTVLELCKIEVQMCRNTKQTIETCWYGDIKLNAPLHYLTTYKGIYSYNKINNDGVNSACKLLYKCLQQSSQRFGNDIIHGVIT